MFDDQGPSESEQLDAVLQVLREHTRTPDDCYFCLWDGWGWGSEAPTSSAMDGLPTIYGVDGGRFVSLQDATALLGVVPQVFPSGEQRPQVVVPNRAYFLFRGKVSELREWSTDDTWAARSDVPSPAFIWPGDHAWCVANDVDPHWIGIGADTLAVERLIAHPLLGVVPADPREGQPEYH